MKTACVLACVLATGTMLAHANTSESATKQTAPTNSHHNSKTSQAKSGSTHTVSTSKKSRRRASSRRRGQQKIDSQRARQIQEALIREHYLSGKPSGTWDSATQQAMQKYQAENGWQSKTTPDARALIKLGLGPDHEHLLNPESAMTSPAPAPHSVSASAPGAPTATDHPQR